jgi:hypothetical protein
MHGVPADLEPETQHARRLRPLTLRAGKPVPRTDAADQAWRQDRRPTVTAHILILLAGLFAGWAAVLGLMALIALAGARIESLIALRAGIAAVENYANRAST